MEVLLSPDNQRARVFSRQQRLCETPFSSRKCQLFAWGLQTILSAVRWEMICRGDPWRTGSFSGRFEGIRSVLPVTPAGDSNIKIGVARSLEAGHATTNAKKGRSPMVPSFFTISSFYDFFNMLSMVGISFAVKAFSVVVFTLPCELSANANAVCVSSLGHSPIVM